MATVDPSPWVLARGMVAPVSGPLAALLSRYLDEVLGIYDGWVARRDDLRGLLPMVVAQAEAVRAAGRLWSAEDRAAARGDAAMADAVIVRGSAGREIRESSNVVTTAEAAGQLGVTERHARWLAAEGRITGRKADGGRGQWLIERVSVDEYARRLR